jgi:hypothetical protein
MACIDKSLSKAEIDERIENYILDKMTYEERDEFQEHFSDCNYCMDKSVTGQRVAKILKRKFTYDKLIEADKAKDYDKVIELAKELSRLGYREELYPIKDIVRNAVENVSDRVEDFKIVDVHLDDDAVVVDFIEPGKDVKPKTDSENIVTTKKTGKDKSIAKPNDL